jgi:asparagine synthase (glutamine-hydrolysing)
MCGIAGFWQTKQGTKHPLETLDRMGASLAHRGPDDSGTFHDTATGIGFAFRRLSIIDLSPEGHQPMFSDSGRYIIVFNGEVYNFEEIRTELGARHWRGHSDTEVMLEAIERWGLEPAVQRFVGMFAFALWDRQESKLYLVRDRLGIKPLYYGHAGGDFVFASELKAICQHPDFGGTIDRDALVLYMRHNYVPSPHCIYQGLYKLQPGCIMTLSVPDGARALKRFWSADGAAREGLLSRVNTSDAEAVEQLQDKLLSAVRLRMIADVPLGAFLSGGIDSSTVVALMQAQSNRPVRTFTIGFREGGYNEATHARKIAAHLGTEHTELYLTPKDALDVVPLLPSMYDEPFSDSSQIPTYLVSKLARSAVTVSLSGDGGDELFGGYKRYPFTKSVWNALKRIPRPARKAMAGMLRAIPPGAINRSFQLFHTFLPEAMRLTALGDKAHKFADLLPVEGPEALYHRVLSQWEIPSNVVRNSHDPRTIPESITDSAWLPNIEEIMMLTDQLNYLPDDILTKVDRASMAVSLEARVPLLDHRVVEFAWKLPLHFKIRKRRSKWILRQVLYKYVPPELVERAKMGFGVPIGLWLRGPLRDWAEDLLSARSLAQHGLLEVGMIRLKWLEHLSGIRNWQNVLWDVLVFQDWFSQNGSVHQGAGPSRHRNIGLMESGLREV